MCAHQVRSYGPRVTTDDRTSRASRAALRLLITRTSSSTRSASRDASESRWAAWFDGLRLTTEADGTTVIRGPVVDQAALHGLLQKLRDVGIPLISLTPVSPDTTTTPGGRP